MKKIPRAFLKPSESAEYLGVTKQRFYVIKYKYQLEPNEDNKYSTLVLSKVRKSMDKWKRDHASKA